MSKKLKIRLLFFIVFITLAIIISIANGHRKCQKLDITVDYKGASVFITTNEIENFLIKEFGNPIGRKLKKINIQDMENILKLNPFIDDVMISKTLSGNINIKVKQKKPILKVFNNVGQQFYISDGGKMMPISFHGTERVIVANGNIKDIYLTNRDLKNELSNNIDSLTNRTTIFKIWYLVSYIEKDIFLKSIIEQVYIGLNGDIELVPKIGNHLIVFGNIDDIEKKFYKLKAIYKEVLNKKGWDRYAIINLKYSNQVVCTKKLKN